jgi:hypothetical protein
MLMYLLEQGLYGLSATPFKITYVLPPANMRYYL